MTIDEAIIQFKEDAECNRADIEFDWAEENEQVAKWLEELKAIKESAVFYSNRPIEDIVLEARADAIDEMTQTIREIEADTTHCLFDCPRADEPITCTICVLEKAVEQMKGAENE